MDTFAHWKYEIIRHQKEAFECNRLVGNIFKCWRQSLRVWVPRQSLGTREQ